MQGCSIQTPEELSAPLFRGSQVPHWTKGHESPAMASSNHLSAQTCFPHLILCPPHTHLTPDHPPPTPYHVTPNLRASKYKTPWQPSQSPTSWPRPPPRPLGKATPRDVNGTRFSGAILPSRCRGNRRLHWLPPQDAQSFAQARGSHQRLLRAPSNRPFKLHFPGVFAA